MNGPEILIPITFFFMVASIFRTVLKYRERRLELEARPYGGIGNDVRMERIEQAIDAMAVEIERIAEAQRFTTRLLSERGAEESALLPPAAPRAPN